MAKNGVKLNEEGKAIRTSWLYKELRAAIRKQSREQAGDDGTTGVVDALADILHICDDLGLDFADCERRAYSHYREEIEIEVAS